MNPLDPMVKPDGVALIDPAKQSMLLSALYAAQEQTGYLPNEAIEQVAQQMGLNRGQVHSTASFYTLFHMKPVGHYVIQVCDGITCYLLDGADKVADYISARLGIQPGETTADGRFTLETVECLAACGAAPVMRIDDQLYENLTPTRIDAILQQLAEEV